MRFRADDSCHRQEHDSWTLNKVFCNKTMDSNLKHGREAGMCKLALCCRFELRVRSIQDLGC